MLYRWEAFIFKKIKNYIEIDRITRMAAIGKQNCAKCQEIIGNVEIRRLANRIGRANGRVENGANANENDGKSGCASRNDGSPPYY